MAHNPKIRGSNPLPATKKTKNGFASTVFLGVDYSFMQDSPLILFETKVFEEQL
jgi:hypothetical protein